MKRKISNNTLRDSSKVPMIRGQELYQVPAEYGSHEIERMLFD